MRCAIVGLTGGIGSGKSVVARMMSKHGVAVLDLDALGHQLLQEPTVIDAIVAHFGASVCKLDGFIDRKRLGAVCFADANQLQALNTIMHPRLWQQAMGWANAHATAHERCGFVLMEGAVLIEAGFADHVDALVVVLADEMLRQGRIFERDQCGKERVMHIMSHQCDDAQRMQQADYVLNNNEGLQALEVAVDSLYHTLCARFSQVVSA